MTPYALEGPLGVVPLDPDVVEVVRGMRVSGNVAFIDRPLDRELYLRVNKALEALGGKWNRKFRGHVFEGDPSEALMRAVVEGQVVDPRKAFGFFETPPDTAESMAFLARLEPGMRVLEPSAGRGAIADAVRDVCPQCRLEAVEIDSKNREVLKTKGHRLVGKDFMKFRPKGCYDRIVMNPPFAKQQDIDHVTKAFRHLCPGGRLVAVMSAGTRSRETKKAVAFRTLVGENGTMEDLAPETFAAAGTLVNTVLVTLDKPGRDKGTVYFTYDDTGPDDWGRRRFMIDWWDKGRGRWKGQVFHAKPEPYLELWKEQGLKIVEKGPE